MRPLHAFSLSLFLCATSLASPAFAAGGSAKVTPPSEEDEPGAVPDEPEVREERAPAPGPQGGDAHPEGEYGGVTPGKARPTRDDGKPKKVRQVAPRTLTWLGFQVQGGAPVVFVQLSSDVTPEQTIEGKVLTVRFAGAKLDRSRNLARFIDTRFFKTDVLRVEAKADKKAGVVVRVTFKDAARKAQVGGDSADGGRLVLLSF